MIQRKKKSKNDMFTTCDGCVLTPIAKRREKCGKTCHDAPHL